MEDRTPPPARGLALPEACPVFREMLPDTHPDIKTSSAQILILTQIHGVHPDRDFGVHTGLDTGILPEALTRTPDPVMETLRYSGPNRPFANDTHSAADARIVLGAGSTRTDSKQREQASCAQAGRLH